LVSQDEEIKTPVCFHTDASSVCREYEKAACPTAGIANQRFDGVLPKESEKAFVLLGTSFFVI
jgi:hypothetical protein